MPTRCLLGEGLFVDHSSIAWVDIDQDLIFLHENGKTSSLKTQYKPSVIFSKCGSHIIYGSEAGLTMLDSDSGSEEILSSIFSMHDRNSYRSNDGGYLGNLKVLSFMHRNRPTRNPGYVYVISNNVMHLIDNSIHIPNTFIEIAPRRMLVSDSYTSEIWLFEFSPNGALLQKRLWTAIDGSISPDGGCMVKNKIFICLWDDASIGVFDIQGRLIQKLPVSVVQPTNCKFDQRSSQLFVTSASSNLSKEQLLAYPDSGKTLIYQVE